MLINPPVRIDGQTAHEDRDKQIQEYNAEGSSKFIFMLSTRSVSCFYLPFIYFNDLNVFFLGIKLYRYLHTRT